MTAEGVPAISRLPNDIWREHSFVQRFQVEAELGSGGQAIVVSAYHRELDERVALKFLLPEVAQSTAAVARFRREARAAAKIKNEHVVRIFDVCSTESGLPYIVMEHLTGHDLEHCLQTAENHQLEVGIALDFILQASEALAEGHRFGIVHRDLKPANLFCVDRDDGSPMIKVLDFGISKIKPLAGDVERTDRYEILGSPRYMSPEQIDASRDVDLRSDIWSLGVILYQALTGRAPFASDIVAELWHLVRTATPPLPSTLRADLPLALDGIVMRCLEKERTRRYANLGELAEALYYIAPPRCRRSIERIRHITGTTSMHASAPGISTDATLQAVPSSRRSPRPRTVIIGVGLAATALGGLATTRFVTTRPETPIDVRTTSFSPAATPVAHPASTATDKPKPEPAVPRTDHDRTASEVTADRKLQSVAKPQWPTRAQPAILTTPAPIATPPGSTPATPSVALPNVVALPAGGSTKDDAAAIRSLTPERSTAVPLPSTRVRGSWISPPVSERRKSQ